MAREYMASKSRALPGTADSGDRTPFPIRGNGAIGGLRSGNDLRRHGLSLATVPSVSSPCLRQDRSEEHPSELQSLMRISYAVFCLTTKRHTPNTTSQESR